MLEGPYWNTRSILRLRIEECTQKKLLRTAKGSNHAYKEKTWDNEKIQKEIKPYWSTGRKGNTW